MQSKTIGKVSVEEKDEIEGYVYRQNSLVELLGTAEEFKERENEELYEKVLNDLAEVKKNMAKWWQETSKKYGWESHDQGNWNIDFASRDITFHFPEQT